MKEFSIIGKSPLRVDALDKVTGNAKFTADYLEPRMLHIKVVRSTYAHAKITRIDTSRAEKLSGVKGVVTPKDILAKRTGIFLLERYLLPCDNIVRYVGERIALVVATTKEIAEEAVKLVEVDYKELPAVFDAEQSIKENPTAIVHPELRNYTYIPIPRYPQILDPNLPNVMNSARLRTGDIEKGFEESDLIIENRFVNATVQHCPIEPHIIDAWVEIDGTLIIRTSSQGLFSIQSDLSQFFGIPTAKLRVIGPYCGGGFGSKIARLPEHLVAATAMKLRKPVRLEYTREEEFIEAGRRAKQVVYLKDGVKRDGTLVSREAKVIIDVGAYGADYMAVSASGAMFSMCPYRIPNTKMDFYAVYTNNTPCTTMRAVESPGIVWAVEGQMECIAERLGLDPVELRRKNMLKDGERSSLGITVSAAGAAECLNSVVKSIELGTKPQVKGNWITGKGVAFCTQPSMRGYSASSLVKVYSDGTVEVRYGASELGMGASTVMAQIAAEEFGVSLDKIKLVRGDTAFMPWDYSNNGSRTTPGTGWAVLRACQDAKQQICELAAPMMKLGPSDLDVGNGKVYWKDWPKTAIQIGDLFTPQGFAKGSGEIIGRGEYTAASPNPPDIYNGQYGRLGYDGWGAYGVEVGVNLETGEVKLLRVAGSFDVGQPINPKMYEGQIEGGMAMGLGAALYEELLFNNGRVLNPTFMTYKIPTFGEIPSIEDVRKIIVKAPHPDCPYGAKGGGEIVVSPMAPAIAAAVYNAVGVRIRESPITREKVLKALEEVAE